MRAALSLFSNNLLQEGVKVDPKALQVSMAHLPLSVVL